MSTEPQTPSKPSLFVRSASGGGWMLASRVVVRSLGLVNMVVLARLLTPLDFGLVALAGGIAAGVDGLLALGVEDAVVRDHEAPRQIYDTAFTVAAIRGVTVALIVAISARPAGQFFHDPRLQTILYALAIATGIEGFSNTGVAEFRRTFAFDKEFKRFMLPRIASFIVTLTAAFVLRSYWALVIGILTNRGLRVAGGYILHPFRPRLSLSRWRTIVGYASWTWVLGLIGMVRDRSAAFALGRLFTPLQVGIFSVAGELAALPSTEFVEPLCHVLFSGFAEADREGHDLRATFLRMGSLVLLATLPAGLGLSIVAGPFLTLVFGSRWSAAIPALSLLAVAYTISGLGTISVTFLSARARFRGILAGVTAGAVVRVSLLVLLCPRYGVEGAAIAVLVSFLVEMLGFFIEAAIILRISLRAFLGHLWRPLVGLSVMSGCLSALGLAWAPPAADTSHLLANLAITVIVGASAYSLTLTLAWVASGRPDSAELDVWRIAAASYKKLRARFGRQVL